MREQRIGRRKVAEPEEVDDWVPAAGADDGGQQWVDEDWKAVVHPDGSWTTYEHDVDDGGDGTWWVDETGKAADMEAAKAFVLGQYFGIFEDSQ